MSATQPLHPAPPEEHFPNLVVGDVGDANGRQRGGGHEQVEDNSPTKLNLHVWHCHLTHRGSQTSRAVYDAGNRGQRFRVPLESFLTAKVCRDGRAVDREKITYSVEFIGVVLVLELNLLILW